MFESWKAARRLKKRLGFFNWLRLTPREMDQFIESEKFWMLVENCDKRRLWALITGWDKLTDKPAVWKDGLGSELVPPS